MRLQKKLTLTFLACGLVPMALAITFAFWNAKSGFSNIEQFSTTAFENQINNQMSAVRDIKKSQIEDYFTTIRNQILTFSTDESIISAMEQFKTNFANYAEVKDITDEQVVEMRKELGSYYTESFGSEYKNQNPKLSSPASEWLAKLDREAVIFQYNYIKENSNPLGSKHQLDAAEDGSQYSDTHLTYHPMIRTYLEKFGFYDIFLVDPETGDVVYSVYKELDFGTSLLDGPHSQTNFAQCFRRAAELNTTDSFILVDYKQYGPSYEAPASFIASPIYRGDTRVGIAMFQMPIDYVNQVMGVRTGMGESGETYLVGPDHLMRCDSYRDPENRSIITSFKNPETGRVETVGVVNALKGEQGTITTSNYAGKEVLCSYTPIDILGNRWALLSEIEKEEAFASIGQIRNTANSATSSLVSWMLGLTAVVGTGVILLGWNFSKRIVTPVLSIAKQANRIANGDLREKLDYHSSDELGELASSFNDMKESIQTMSNETSQMVSEARDGKLDARADSSRLQGCYRELIEKTNDLVKAFGEPVSEIRDCMQQVASGNLTARMSGSYSGDFNSLAHSINAALNQIDNTISDVSLTTGHVAKASNDVHRSSQNIAEGSTEQASSLEEIASSLEEMTSMTKHASENATQAKLLAKETREAADSGKTAMTRMSEAIEKIKSSSDEQAKIVRTIDEIAFQTNLLALNAAVEAARAGEAGKGFAVVAEEVRSLAQRSAEAARTTASMIDSSVESSTQGVSISKEVAASLDQILNSAQKTDDLVAEIAAASKEQSQGIDQVNTAIGQLDVTTQSAAETSQSSADIATVLSRNVEELRRLVNRFRVSKSEKQATEMLEEIDTRMSKKAPKPKKETKPVVKQHHEDEEAEELIPFGDDNDFSDF